MSANEYLSADQRTAICTEFGHSGHAWVAGFDALLAACCERWQLTLTGCVRGGLPINVIAFATRSDGSEVVLKIGHPHPEQATEMITLNAWHGRHCARVVDHDIGLGALLLERITPGTTLRAAVAPQVRSSLHVELLDTLPQPCAGLDGLPRFDDWLRHAFAEFHIRHDRTHPFAAHIERARTLWSQVQRHSPGDWLLHGDLHHENILLDATRGWLAIDPKGVIGPRVMECGRYLHNFLEDELGGVRPADADPEQLMAIYATRFAATAATLDEPQALVAAANCIDIVLATTWTLNSGDATPDAIALVDAAALMCDRLPLPRIPAAC